MGHGTDGEQFLADERKWTIRRVMVGIACLAPLLALARHPFAFGFVVTAGAILLFVGVSYRRRRYHRIAWLVCLYPALPLVNLYLSWALLRLRYVRRSSMGLLDGMFGVSDIGAYLCLMAYVGCVSILIRGADPALGRAAKRVVLLMPVTWAAFLAFSFWDPFGVLSTMFRF